MPDNKEPGLLDILDSLFSDGDSNASKPVYKCNICNGDGYGISVQCACGWKLEGCLSCSLVPGSPAPINDHRRECEKLQRQIEISRMCQ